METYGILINIRLWRNWNHVRVLFLEEDILKSHYTQQ